MGMRSAKVNGKRKTVALQARKNALQAKKDMDKDFLVHASNAVLWAFSATILRPLTLARNYANLRRTKKQIEEMIDATILKEYFYSDE